VAGTCTYPRRTTARQEPELKGLDVSSELFSTRAFLADIGYPEQGNVGGLGLGVSCSPSTDSRNESRRERFQYWNAYNFSFGISILIENE
jgi:hypothetical protein